MSVQTPNDVEDLAETVGTFAKVFAKRIVRQLSAAIEDVDRWSRKDEPQPTPSKNASSTEPQGTVDFQIGTYHRFSGSEINPSTVYKVCNPLRHIGNDWHMQVETMDGIRMEYPLRNIHLDPLISVDHLREMFPTHEKKDTAENQAQGEGENCLA